MSSEWSVVSGKKGKAATRASTADPSARGSEEQIRSRVRTFKTTVCNLGRLCADGHACPKCHEWEDLKLVRRRDPFSVWYEAEQCDDIKQDGSCGRGDLCPFAHTQFEVMYHPARWAHVECKDGRMCRRNAHCAFAHSAEEQALARDIEREWEQHWAGDIGAKTVSSSGALRLAPRLLHEFIVRQEQQELLTEMPRIVFGGSMSQPASAASLPARFIELNSLEELAVRTSRALWRSLEDTAARNLCTLVCFQAEQAGPVCLRLQGNSAQHALADVERQLKRNPPAGVFVHASATFPQVAVERVRNDLEHEGQRAFNEGDDSVWVTANVELGTVVVRALNDGRPRRAGQLNAAQQTLNRIRFWLRKAGYDKTFQCASCLDDFSGEDVVQCSQGHAFCTDSTAEDGCFGRLLSTSLATIQASAGQLLCPLCRVPFETQQVAAHVSSGTWATLQGAVLDAHATKRYTELQIEFDARLRQKINELLASYEASHESALKATASAAATEARNSVLNLMCPKCKAVYAEFDGCMALQCTSCRAHFCAYCHKACANSSGAHQHVRECDMNLTAVGSFYADKNAIKDAQRRYRVKALKKFLRSGAFKTSELQNAIVLELSRDLSQLGIDVGALLQFAAADLR